MKGNGHLTIGLRLLDTSDVDEGDEGDDRIDPEGGRATAVDRSTGGDVADLLAFVLGAIGLAVDALIEVIHQADPREHATNDEVAGLLRTAAFAGLGLTAEVARRTAAATDRSISAAAPAIRFLTERTPLGAPVRWLEAFGEQAHAEQQKRQQLAAPVVEALIPQIVSAVVERIDIDGIVRGVDIPAVVDRVEVNAIVAKVDIDRIIDRLDIDAIAARIDLNAIVSRIDVNAIAARVDVQAIIDQVDLPTMTMKVMDEVDIGEIIRESTGSITTETVDAIRYQGMNADRMVSRVVDRILFRKGDRDVAIPLPPAEAAAPAPTSTHDDGAAPA